MKRNILTVFLASPNDLPDERRIVRNTVDRVNKVLSRSVGWQIELLGWEDTLPGGVRPQELINKDVDSCQLFIGILWRRWGQETGKYSSGFEEEFLRAKERRESTGSPELWLFFKAVDEDIAKDPGEQLKKVLNFKKELIESKQLMFKEFDETETWGPDIYDYLLQYVLDLSKKETEIESQEESILAGQARESHPDTKSKEKGEIESYPAELISLFNKINETLSEGKPVELEESDRIRLYLQSSEWFSAIHLGEVFGNHEINLVYTRRKGWELSDSEIWYLVRSFLSDTDNNRPGWYWIKNKPDNEIEFLIIWLATNDRNIDVRRSALALLVDVGFNASRDLLETGMSDSDKQVILRSIDLIRLSGDLDNIDLLDKVIDNDDSNIRQVAMNTKIDIMYLNNPTQGFSYLVDSGSYITPLIKKTLDDMSLSIDNKLLFNALKKAGASVRRFSAQYLRKLNLLTKNICYESLKDTDAVVRKECLLQLIDLNEDVDMDFIKKLFPEENKGRHGLGLAFQEVRANDFIPILLKKRDPETLLSQLDFFDIESDDAYKILSSEHYALIESRIRSDLDEAFDTLRKVSEARFKEKYGFFESVYKPDVINSIRDRFIAAAINGLDINGGSDDIKYARKYIGKTLYNMADKGAVRLIAKFGDESDIDNLIEAASKNYGETRIIALQTAYNFSTDKDDLLARLINHDDDAIAKIAAQILSSHESPKKVDIAINLINSKSDKRRVIGISILSKLYESKELEELLDDYISQPSYYYNVVTWLDRILYSKGRYLINFKSKLSKSIE